MTVTKALDDQLTNPRRAFSLLVLYRWISLIPPAGSLILALSDSELPWRLVFALGFAVILNGLISIFYRPLNRDVRRYPQLLAVDLILVAALIALTGGWQTPYYLYALSPLLAAAFFFRFRGAVITTTVFAPLYLAAVLVAYSFGGESPNWLVVIMAIVGFYLISAVFGYAAALMQHLRSAGDDLADAHRDLEVIHDLTTSLQSAADVNEVEERVLEAVTTELNFDRAVVALVDEDEQTITAWISRARQGPVSRKLPHSAQLPLSAEGGVVSQALLDGSISLSALAPLTSDEAINAHLEMEQAHIFPLLLREHPVGVLLVEAGGSRNDAAGLHSLQSIANQAAVSLGTTMMCIDRAQRLAIQEERIRIAQDIHDTVSQSLFGIVYTLDGCLKLLPDQPQAVEPELRRVLGVAEETRAEIRKSILDIWPSTLTAGQFVSDLDKYATTICQIDDLALDFQVSGDFSMLSSRARRSLYRISQEALANIGQHSAASRAQVCVEVTDKHAILSVRDNGNGFDPDQVMQRVYGREHFGLRGMQERARSLGGACEINSRPGAGSTVIVDIPLSDRQRGGENGEKLIPEPTT